MINANELRIGNFLYSQNKRHNEDFIVVESIASDRINKYSNEELIPIPLTEELAKKFGFEWFYNDLLWIPNANGNGSTKDYFNPVIEELENYWAFYIDNNLQNFIEINFVHELQNTLNVFGCNKI